MELQSVFYIVAIVVMALSLIAVIALLVMVLTIRAKVLATHDNLQRKVDLAGNVLSRMVPVLTITQRVLWLRRILKR